MRTQYGTTCSFCYAPVSVLDFLYTILSEVIFHYTFGFEGMVSLISGSLEVCSKILLPRYKDTYHTVGTICGSNLKF